ncbi:hypothetical protein MsAm2_06760 [Methanolapillus ohkumae]|uniref:Uncharacterized protein n=1 Tax=Methanolapillus ohkumae TaxID=3028298 RepID=A0AA96V5I6_9EURY|nr:hypothetical protein MsAm2_06760 [Methanosarcinaceae archaeon Am2]
MKCKYCDFETLKEKVKICFELWFLVAVRQHSPKYIFLYLKVLPLLFFVLKKSKIIAIISTNIYIKFALVSIRRHGIQS